MRVQIPTPLHSYTAGRSSVEAEGATLGELLADLEARYPGIRFRIIDEQDGIREHIRLFINGAMVSDLSPPLGAGDEVFIMAALSGG